MCCASPASHGTPAMKQLTPSLFAARNDTGRIAYCGPVVVSAVTGWSVSRVEQAIRDANPETHAPGTDPVEGTTTADIEAALAVFDFEMTLQEDYNHLEKKERPTVWGWMQGPRNAWRHYILAVHTGRTGHWICVKGTKLCDTYTGGAWVFVSDGPHKGRKIMEVYAVGKRVPRSPAHT